MAHDRLIPPDLPAEADEVSRPAPTEKAALPGPADWGEEEGSTAPNLGRYLHAVWRRKWLLAVALGVGAGGAAVAWNSVQLQYTAVGNLWIQTDRERGAGSGDVAPIRASGLFQANAWIELLRSYAVLDPVVREERIYLDTQPRYRPAFASFDLADQFAPGSYRLVVSGDGHGYVLQRKGGDVVERGVLGDSIGTRLGFRWAPDPKALGTGAEVDFSVVPPREASTALSNRLRTRMDRDANFIGLSLDGTDPERTASILNAIMDRHIAVAADLKKGKLDEVLSILQEQLRYAQQELEQAEADLESFRVNTITLPSDNSTPIAPGLEATRAPVFGRFFQMKVTLEQLRHDRQQLQAVLAGLVPGQDVRVEALQAIPAAASSIELQQVLQELVDARSELRTLRDRYSDNYPPIQDQLTRIRTLQTEAVPRVLASILSELRTQESDLSAQVDSASEELAAIPPRTIEEARLQRRVAIQERLYNDLRQRVETARLASASSIPDVQILDRASAPHRPSDDPRLPLAGMILAGSLAAALALAILLDRVDPRIRYPMQVSREVGLDILGSIPRIQNGRGSKGEENAAQVLEAFRELRLTIGFAYGSAGPVIVAITSPSQGEGKSLISTNLAVAFAEVGRRTLLIDADTRRGDAHRLLARGRSPGLTDYLRQRSSDDIIQTTEYDRLHFIGSGTRSWSTPELLASPRMAGFLGAMKRDYEVIIVDTPPLAAGGDAVLLGALTGHLAVVIRTGETDKALTMAKLQPLHRLPIRILGAILNDVEPNTHYYRYYYSSYLPGYEAGIVEDEAGPPLLAQKGHPDQAS